MTRVKSPKLDTFGRLL